MIGCPDKIIGDLGFRNERLEKLVIGTIGRLEQVLRAPAPTVDDLLAAIETLKADTEKALASVQVDAAARLKAALPSAEVIRMPQAMNLERPDVVPA